MDAAARIKEALQSLGDALAHFVSVAPERVVDALNESLSPRLSEMDRDIDRVAKSCDRLESMVMSLPGREGDLDLADVMNGLHELRSMLQGIPREPGCLGVIAEIRRVVDNIQQRLVDGNLDQARLDLTDLISRQSAAVSHMERARVAVELAANRVSGSGISATIARTWNFIAVDTFKIDKLTINPFTVKVSILSLAGATIYFNIGDVGNFFVSAVQQTRTQSLSEPYLDRIAQEIAKLKGGSEAERKAIADAFERLEKAMKSGKPESRKAAFEILLSAVNKVSDQAAQTIAGIIGDINARFLTFEGGVVINNWTGSDPAVRESLGRIEKLLLEKPNAGQEKSLDQDAFLKRIVDELRRNGAVGKTSEVPTTLPGDITFERNTARIKSIARQAITVASKEANIKHAGATIFVLGHADEIHFKEDPTRIEKEIRINERLSSDRAQAVARLVAGNAPSLQVYYLGLGSAFPLKDNLSGQGNAANRRVDFQLCKTYTECGEKLGRLTPVAQPHYPVANTFVPRRVELP